MPRKKALLRAARKLSGFEGAALWQGDEKEYEDFYVSTLFEVNNYCPKKYDLSLECENKTASIKGIGF